MTVKVNGVISAELRDDPSRPGGQLAMQMHAGNEMRVMFKDIKIRPVSKSGPDKTAPSKPEKIQPNEGGQIVLAAAQSRIDGVKLAYMPEWDALGFWRKRTRPPGISSRSRREPTMSSWSGPSLPSTPGIPLCSKRATIDWNPVSKIQALGMSTGSRK